MARQIGGGSCCAWATRMAGGAPRGGASLRRGSYPDGAACPRPSKGVGTAHRQLAFAADGWRLGSAILPGERAAPAGPATDTQRASRDPDVPPHRSDHARASVAEEGSDGLAGRLLPADGWIESHGYHTVTQLQLWDALMHGRPLPAHPVLVTFDDAYRDVVTYAAPVLRHDHEHATAYVITDRLSHGRRSPWMLWTHFGCSSATGSTSAHTP
jgi:hypothetical protein